MGFSTIPYFHTPFPAPKKKKDGKFPIGLLRDGEGAKVRKDTDPPYRPWANLAKVGTSLRTRRSGSASRGPGGGFLRSESSRCLRARMSNVRKEG